VPELSAEPAGVRRPEILLVVEILGGGFLREWALPVDRDEFESGEVAVAGLAVGEVEAEGGCGSGCWEGSEAKRTAVILLSFFLSFFLFFSSSFSSEMGEDDGLESSVELPTRLK